MKPDEILKAFNNIRVWQRGDRRAPPRSGVPRKGPARLRIPLLRLRAWPAAQAPANRPRSRAHKVVSGRRAGRRAEWPCLMLAAPQGFRSRRIHHPPGRLRHGVQPASVRQRRKAAFIPRGKYSAPAKHVLPAEQGVPRLARGSGFQEAWKRCYLKKLGYLPAFLVKLLWPVS